MQSQPPSKLMAMPYHLIHSGQTTADESYPIRRPVKSEPPNTLPMWWDLIVVTILQYILTRYFCIDCVNPTASGPP